MDSGREQTKRFMPLAKLFKTLFLINMEKKKIENEDLDFELTYEHAAVNKLVTVSEILSRHHALCLSYSAALKRVIDNPRDEQVKLDLKIAAKNLENYVSKQYIPL